jgi:hypothetical protein
MLVPSALLHDRKLNSMGGAKLNKEKIKKFFAEKSMLTPLESTKQSQNREQISTFFTGPTGSTGPSRPHKLNSRFRRPCDDKDRLVLGPARRCDDGGA